MNESINSIGRLLQEVTEHLKAGTKADKSAAYEKLQSIAAVASTLAFTVKMAR